MPKRKSEPLLDAEETQRFRNAVDNIQQTVQEHLSAHKNVSYAINFVSNLHRGVDKIVETAKDQGVKFDCQPGCSYCCHVRVQVSTPEIFLIVMEIRKLPKEALNKLIERLRKHVALVKDLSIWEHHAECPFLNNSLCSIYSVRPAVCRKTHSLDVEKCRTPGSDIPGDLGVTIKAEALIKGTGNGYSKSNLPFESHELGEAVLLALTDKTTEIRWFGGETLIGK